MQAPLMLTALGAPIDLVVTGSQAPRARAALAERWTLCARELPDRGSRVVEVRFGEEEASTPTAAVDAPHAAGAELDRLLVEVTQHVTWQAIDAGVGSLVMFHAAAVADLETGAAVVCVAPGGTGKTTLCRTLGPGRGYLSDETVAVDADGTILAYPKPLSVRRGDGGPSSPKDEVAPADYGLVPATTQPHAAALLLLARDPGGPDEPVVEHLDLFDAIIALTPETSSLARLPRPLHRLAELLGSLSLLARVHYREAASLEALVGRVAARPGGAVVRVRSVPVIDQLEREGERLVLLPERAVRLVGLAPALLDLASDWSDLGVLTEQLEDRFGAPSGGDAAELVRHAVHDLAAEGLVELDGQEGR